MPQITPILHDGDQLEDRDCAGHTLVGDQRSDVEEEEENQDLFMDEAGNFDDYDMTPVPITAAEPVRDLRVQQPTRRGGGTGATVPGLRIRQLSPTAPTAHPPGQSIWFLSAPTIRAQITRHPQPGELVSTALGLRGWIPGQPIGGTNTMFAELIGS